MKKCWLRHPDWPRMTLHAIADMINAGTAQHGYHACVSAGYYSTDSVYAGTRIRRVGKGREGLQIVIYKYAGQVLRHNGADPCRRNEEVLEWVEKTLGRIWETQATTGAVRETRRRGR